MSTFQTSRMSNTRIYVRARAISDIVINRISVADENPSGEQEGPSIRAQLGHDLRTHALFPLEAIDDDDDDVVEISARAFAEAKKNSRRNCLRSIDDLFDVDLDEEQPLKKIVFSCPICMGPFVEEMTTRCGHIFCKTCIETAIVAQAKCPICRKKTNVNQLIRVFLPTTD